VVGAASRHVAIGIGRHEAILTEFEVGPSASTIPRKPGDGWSEYRMAAQRYTLVEQYYAAVLAHS
jgi:hypothetical protein